MKKIFFAALLLLFLYSPYTYAQSSLGIDATAFSYSYKDTTSFNSLDNFKVKIKNYGPQAFSGPVQVVYAVDTSNIGSTITPIVTDSSTRIIAVNASVADSVAFSISPGPSGAFRSGINTVVIWPRSGAFTTHDSLKLSVYVMGFAGINKNTAERTIVFPNPAHNLLFIANRDPYFIIEQVRILDVLGQPVYLEEFRGYLDVSKLANGAYTLEFLDKNGRASRYKVIKE